MLIFFIGQSASNTYASVVIVNLVWQNVRQRRPLVKVVCGAAFLSHGIRSFSSTAFMVVHTFPCFHPRIVVGAWRCHPHINHKERHSRGLTYLQKRMATVEKIFPRLENILSRHEKSFSRLEKNFSSVAVFLENIREPFITYRLPAGRCITPMNFVWKWLRYSL